MSEKLKGIMLSTVRHSDRAVIANVYTETRGSISLLVNVGSNRSASRMAPLLMPLAQVEFECPVRSGKELQRPRSLAFTRACHSIYFSPAKSAICFFISEFLTRLLRRSDADRLVFRYVSESIIALDMLPAREVANFHIAFLSGLTTFMGVTPDLESYTPGALFDMRAGTYATMLPGHNDILVGESALVPLTLYRLNYANMSRLHLSRANRAAVLEGLLRYWGIHFPGVAGMRSPEVLATLFD